MTEENKERIKFNTEIIKLLTLLFIASAGGVISLILQGLSQGKHVILSAGGMIIAIATGISAFVIYRNTEKLIK